MRWHKRVQRDPDPPVPDTIGDLLPAWGALLLAGAAYWLSRRDIATVWLTGMIATALGATTVDLLPPRAARFVGTLTTSAQWCAWVAVGVHLFHPQQRVVIIGAGALAWCTTTIGWQRLSRRHPWTHTAAHNVAAARAVATIRDHWPAFVSAAHLPDGSTFIRGKRTQRGGVRITGSTPGAASAVEKSAGNVASVLHVGADRVHIIADPHNNSIFHMDIDPPGDPLATPVPWMAPRVGRSITTDVTLAVDESGHMVQYPLVSDTHILIGGRTRSGKTQALQIVCAAVAASRDADLWIVDAVKHGSDYMRWRHTAARFLTDAPDILAGLTELRALMRDRYATRAANGTSGVWNPRTEGRQIVVVVDEASTSIADDVATREVFRKLAQEAAGAGITLVVGTQSPQHKVFDVNTRRQIGARLALSVESATASNICLRDGDAAAGYNAATLPCSKTVKGYAYAYLPEWQHPMKCRTLWATDAALNEFARTLPPRARAADPTPESPASDVRRDARAHADAGADADVCELDADTRAALACVADAGDAGVSIAAVARATRAHTSRAGRMLAELADAGRVVLGDDRRWRVVVADDEEHAA